MPQISIPMASIGEGERRTLKVGQTEVLIACVYGQYFAVEARCTHAMQSLSRGTLREYEITCPRHGARFDLRTGSCTQGPAQNPIQRFPVQLEAGKVCIEVNN